MFFSIFHSIDQSSAIVSTICKHQNPRDIDNKIDTALLKEKKLLTIY